ncbi:MAG: GAF domain-containing protein, partial [Synechococcus sp.]|nr:GAF domain-containing protein [Synechococcus sp.]
MPAAPKPSNEKDRLRALSEYRILGTKPEESFDNITSMAAMICHAPIALISLVDEDRQWFKSRVGCDQLETERDVSFCAHSILSAKPLIVEDALFDKRFSDNPLVHKDPHIRLYAGFPLSTPSQQRIGTLCVIDRIPKSLTSVQVQVMQRLA